MLLTSVIPNVMKLFLTFVMKGESNEWDVNETPSKILLSVRQGLYTFDDQSDL